MTDEERAKKLLEYWNEQPMPQHVLVAEFADVRAEERAAIVAWLRSRFHDRIADQIERDQ